MFEDITHFKVNVEENGVAEVIFNRPKKLNSFTPKQFDELGIIFERIDKARNIRVAIISAEGKHFTAGLDLKEATTSITSPESFDSKRELMELIKRWQNSMINVQRCKKPVIVATNGYVLGAGIDLICSCDIRLATKDAIFSIRETKLAMVADMGTLQRIEKLMSPSLARLMAFTGADFKVEELGTFITKIYETKEEMLKEARQIALTIASNSPVAVQGAKISLNYAENHSFEESLDQVAQFNGIFLKNEDLVEAFSSFFEKRKPKFKSCL